MENARIYGIQEKEEAQNKGDLRKTPSLERLRRNRLEPHQASETLLACGENAFEHYPIGGWREEREQEGNPN